MKVLLHNTSFHFLSGFFIENQDCLCFQILSLNTLIIGFAPAAIKSSATMVLLFKIALTKKLIKFN